MEVFIEIASSSISTFITSIAVVNAANVCFHTHNTAILIFRLYLCFVEVLKISFDYDKL